MTRLVGARISGGPSLNMCISMTWPQLSPKMCKKCLPWQGLGSGPSGEVLCLPAHLSSTCCHINNGANTSAGVFRPGGGDDGIVGGSGGISNHLPRYPGGSRKRSRTADSSLPRAASEAPSETGSMDWAGSVPAGEEEEILPNGNEPTPVPPSLDEHVPSVEVGCSQQACDTLSSWLCNGNCV